MEVIYDSQCPRGGGVPQGAMGEARASQEPEEGWDTWPKPLLWFPQEGRWQGRASRPRTGWLEYFQQALGPGDCP